MLLGVVLGLPPEAVHSQSRGLFMNLLPAVFVVHDGREKRHHFNGLRTWWMWIPALTCQAFSLTVLPTQQRHWQHKVDVKSLKPSSLVWLLPVQHK